VRGAGIVCTLLYSVIGKFGNGSREWVWTVLWITLWGRVESVTDFNNNRHLVCIWKGDHRTHGRKPYFRYADGKFQNVRRLWINRFA
jgi:hypothetical protein